MNKEQSPKPGSGRSSLTQEAINRAFSNQPRESTMVYRCASERVVVLNGKSSGNLAVEDLRHEGLVLPVAALERTLVDVIVRPAYAGGADRLISIFRAARERVSVERLLDVLRRLDYVYPYQQVLGFCMERAEFDSESLAMVESLGRPFDFYLANRIVDPLYSSRWRLFYPAQLDALET
ncbi:hypothetical protein L6R52_06280 [Myxococcota bacterium]|nr:hypothetical protein [Myxococcota bacterium]